MPHRGTASCYHFRMAVIAGILSMLKEGSPVCPVQNGRCRKCLQRPRDCSEVEAIERTGYTPNNELAGSTREGTQYFYLRI